MNTEKETKAEKPISVRTDQAFYEIFMKMVERLDVQVTDLAELAMKKGLQAAVDEIRQKKAQYHKKQGQLLKEKINVQKWETSANPNVWHASLSISV